MRRTRSAPSRARAESPPPPPDPTHAWNALALVNDWIKHAEAKLAVVLAASGVSIGILLNFASPITDSDPRTTLSTQVTAVLAASGVLTLLPGTFAMVGLFPQVGKRGKKFEAPGNPLFFHDIAHAYRGEAPKYGEVLHTLSANRGDLVRHIAQQVHANANVARRKFLWADWAVRSLLLALTSLAVVAAVAVVG